MKIGSSFPAVPGCTDIAGRGVNVATGLLVAVIWDETGFVGVFGDDPNEKLQANPGSTRAKMVIKNKRRILSSPA